MKTKRICCERCKRPQSQCYCEGLIAETAQLDIVILQHPSERKHPLNTARIVEIGLDNAEIFVGEDFSQHHALQQLLTTKRCCLLFPTEQALLPQQGLAQWQPQVLIVLDGTWRKAKKIYFCNPNLQQLTCIKLAPQQLSNYRIRKAPSAEGLSTIEAIVDTLRVLAQQRVHQGLLDCFDCMIEQQITHIGSELYQRNYIENSS